MRMEGLDGNFKHLAGRAVERLSEGEVVKVAKIFALLCGRCKERKVPNGSWYRTVKDDIRVLAHIVGQGTYISTVLSGDMTPRGEKI